jgi:hypothetical protein
VIADRDGAEMTASDRAIAAAHSSVVRPRVSRSCLSESSAVLQTAWE